MTHRLFLVDDEAPARARLRDVLSDIAADCPHQVVGEADHAQAALDGIAQCQPDIVLLDVQMPGMNGIELAARIGTYFAQPPSIIFVSAFDDYALKAFDVRALDYLLKPVRAARLTEAIERVGRLRSSQQIGITDAARPLRSTRLHFSVHQRGRVLLVPVADIIYLKAETKYVTLRTPTGEYLIEESLLSLEQEFADLLVRVHRNALVARDAIIGVERGRRSIEDDPVEGLDTWQVILRGTKDRLPISRRQWPVIKALVK
jgi:two-component system response regulator AlgR